MRKIPLTPVILLSVVTLVSTLPAQTKRLWILNSAGEMTEYDPSTFATRLTVKAPTEAAASPQALSVNRLGQMLFAPALALPLSEDDLSTQKKVWFWDGHTSTNLMRGAVRTTAATGSNFAVTESAPAPFLSADGLHLYWFGNRARRLQRDGVDLSTKTTWEFWRTDLAGSGREDLASTAMPECGCATGSCEETCPYAQMWIPEEGVDKFFLITQFIAGQTESTYKSTAVYRENAGKWSASPLDPPLHRILDAGGATAILEAIPDSACCGWENESSDQTLLRIPEKTLAIFDEQATYKNSDYDVSFYTQNGKLSPDQSLVAFTIVATAQPNKPIQLANEGQANPEELQRIRKALLDLPAVEVKSIQDSPRRLVFLPHATLVGWINDKEILIVEAHLAVAYNVATGTRRKSNILVEDAARVFLR